MPNAKDSPKNSCRGAYDSSIGAVFESDLALAMWIQLHASAAFRARFIDHVVGAGQTSNSLVGLSKNEQDPGSGETDLLLIFERIGGGRTALLIELKLNAAFQSRQAERYTERGVRGRRAGRWTEFVTVLVAPQCYITESIALDWQRTLPIEMIVGWMGDDTSIHTALLAEVVRRAALKTTLGRGAIPAATRFWQQYLDYAGLHFPLLEVELARSNPLTRGAAKWAKFGSMTLRKSIIRLSHKSESSRVDLIVRGCSLSQLDAAIGASLRDGMFCSMAGRNAVIGIKVPKVNVLEAFEMQIDSVRAIFESGVRLREFYVLHRERLERLAS